MGPVDGRFRGGITTSASCSMQTSASCPIVASFDTWVEMTFSVVGATERWFPHPLLPLAATASLNDAD